MRLSKSAWAGFLLFLLHAPHAEAQTATIYATRNRDVWELPLLSDPGDKWNYGPGARVLGTIIEKITGASLEAYYQQRIFEPLGRFIHFSGSFVMSSSKNDLGGAGRGGTSAIFSVVWSRRN